MPLDADLVRQSYLTLLDRDIGVDEARLLARHLDNREELLAYLIVTEGALDRHAPARSALGEVVKANYAPPAQRPKPPLAAGAPTDTERFPALHAATLDLIAAHARGHDAVVAFAATDRQFRRSEAPFPHAAEPPPPAAPTASHQQPTKGLRGFVERLFGRPR
jgi:hypothetical protein